ncbi:hypothetical protein AeMF1_009718 [Aphanomyces euteiches]|nr:hypothetical protein AeMF1_009718 [Aphanomyces euteiches]KAH9190775.1 hypothetical protein AeNC1_007257 [Aphanomyces euteiches]
MTFDYTPIAPIRRNRWMHRVLLATPVLMIAIVTSWSWFWMTRPLENDDTIIMLGALSGFEQPIPFSTDTPYAWAKHLQQQEFEEKESSLATTSEWATCSLVQINALYRHGARYPMANDFTKMTSLLETLQVKYKEALPAWLQTYSFAYNQSVAEHLSPSGAEEMHRLAQRARLLADRFNLPKDYSPDAYVFEHTYVLRTKQSAEAFVDAFFPKPHRPVAYKSLPEGQDIPLRFFANCPKYLAWVRNSPNATIETNKLEASPRAATMVKQIREALHLPALAALSWKDLKAAYNICSFEVALDNQTQAWCSLFETHSLYLMDFHSDLKKFYECGPGFNISVDIAAPLLVEMLNTIKDPTLRGYFRFAHAETVLPLACLLGLCEKTPLTAAMSDQAIHSRQYKVARLSPFAGNLAFHVYKCDGSNGPPQRIQLFSNEVHLPLTFCHAKTYCTLEELERHYAAAFHFDFNKECAL